MISDAIRESLAKVCAALNKHGVEFLVIGGAAVNYYGYRRPSAVAYRPEINVDLDFWYNPTISNYHNLLKALDELNVDTIDLKKLVFDPKRTFLKIPHKTFHTDFLPIMEGLKSFSESQRNAEKVTIDGNELFIISYNDLILNKLAVNRSTDKSDVDELNKVKKGRHS
ncbi:nucleotidyltransferase [Fulvivirgaceae bacterium PWU4]|uniref:Nucleotidyltransferase n=1 Tax=Chryseosolibacter histidini TaxID=2782349 RepID=A0AAP2DH87_9BACT|nr:nucleotidyltransferase [Chryseosolibacter histidini]MBT1696206.1 nucleotidyltransferase [Chryseosolibacter histidini]